MSRENVEIVRKANEAFKRGDAPAVLQMLHPDDRVVMPMIARAFWSGGEGGLGPLKPALAAHSAHRRLASAGR
jgi:hypothetical protein